MTSPDKPRKRRLDTEMIREIARIVGAGNCRTVAAAAVRVRDTHLSRWMSMGSKRPTGSVYRLLYDTVTEAEAQWEINTVSVVQADAVDNVRTAQWMLSRHPQSKKRWASAEAAASVPPPPEIDTQAARDWLLDMAVKLAEAKGVDIPTETSGGSDVKSDTASLPG